MSEDKLLVALDKVIDILEGKRNFSTENPTILYYLDKNNKPTGKFKIYDDFYEASKIAKEYANNHDLDYTPYVNCDLLSTLENKVKGNFRAAGYRELLDKVYKKLENKEEPRT